MDTVTRLRYLHFMAGVLENQQQDPYCSSCSALTNSLNEVRQKMQSFFHEASAGPMEIPHAFDFMQADIKTMMTGICSAGETLGQKKAGNCLLPKGVCFVKTSKAILDRIEQA